MPRHKKHRASSNNDSDRLIGWLVSYAMDEQGFFYEIRAGRTLVSSEEGDDIHLLSVDDKNISAPHLAMKATPAHKVMVQDIFSEQGSYITKASSGKENQISGPMKIEHGDWLRIGKYTRFQVCLIDAANQ